MASTSTANVSKTPTPRYDSRPTLGAITKTTKALPNRMLLHAMQKWGKTSFAAQATEPLFLMTRGEDGLETLIKSGQIKETPHFEDQAKTWQELILAVNELIVMDHPHKTFVLDTLNGAERLCHEHVCKENYSDNWEKFDAYGRGQALAVAEIVKLLQLLDRLREKGMNIVLLCHSQVKTFNNPEGPNYDRWEPVLAKQTWAQVDRWVDMILFGNFETFTEKETKVSTKAKATGGQSRIICTERHAAYDAGNRHGLPPEIECGETPAEAWANFINALKKGK